MVVAVGGIVAVEVVTGVDVGVASMVLSKVAVGEGIPTGGVSLQSGVEVGIPVSVSFGKGVEFPQKDEPEESCGLTLMVRPVCLEISSKMAESTGINERNGHGL